MGSKWHWLSKQQDAKERWPPREKAKKRKEFHHLQDRLPYPLRLRVLNLPVPVQNLEDHFAFRFLEGTEADLVGHFHLFLDPRCSYSMAVRPSPGGAQSPAAAPARFTRPSLSYFIGNGVACNCPPLFNWVTLLRRKKFQEALPLLGSSLPEPHAICRAFSPGPAAASDIRLSQKHIFFLRFCQRLL